MVRLESSFLQELHRRCQPMRPKDRLQTEIDVNAKYGLLLPDLSSLPDSSLVDKRGVLSCEIKPKSCILPDTACLCDENKIKAEVARFVMMQHSKLKSGKVHSISAYNPLDLFSLDLDRMRSSILDLLQTPQNNFVLRCFDSEGHSSNITTDACREEVVARCLSVAGPRALSALGELLAVVLADCRVLEEIQRLQALDRFDIENVLWMHRHVSNPALCSEVLSREVALLGGRDGISD